MRREGRWQLHMGCGESLSPRTPQPCERARQLVPPPTPVSRKSGKGGKTR